MTPGAVILVATLAVAVVWAVIMLLALIQWQERGGAFLVLCIAALLGCGNVVLGIAARGQPEGETLGQAAIAGRLLALSMLFLLAVGGLWILLTQRSLKQPGAALWLLAMGVAVTQATSSFFGSALSIRLISFAGVATVVYLSPRPTPEFVRRVFSISCMAVVWASLAVWAIGADWALVDTRRLPLFGDGRLAGVTQHPNSLALVALVALLLVLAKPLPRAWVINAAAAATCLWATDSRSAIATAVPTLAILWVYRSPTARYRGVVIALGALLSLTLIATMPVSQDVQGLNGRTTVAWTLAYEAWQDSPIIGNGADVFDEQFRELHNVPWVGHAHNQLMQSLAETGLLGALAAAAYVAALGLFAFRSARRTRGLSLALVTALLFAMVTESPLRTYGWGLTLLVNIAIFAYLLAAEAASPDGDPADPDEHSAGQQDHVPDPRRQVRPGARSAASEGPAFADR